MLYVRASRLAALLTAVVVTAAGLNSVAAAVDSAVDKSAAAEEIFATVAGQRISLREYQTALQAGLRKRFYHGKVPEEKLAAFRREIGDRLIDRVLLLQEAKRRGLKADEAQVQSKIDQYAARYRDKPYWKEHKEQVLKGLHAAMEEQGLLEQLESTIKNIAAPDVTEIKNYYQRKPELFTTPEAFRASLILLKVDPSSAPPVWEAAFDEARGIVEKLRGGADFAQLARIHSGDSSAAKGGDMGLLHKGMLTDAAQKAIDALAPGETSDPVLLLQGVGIFRLEEHRQPQLNAFEKVKDRVRLLLIREKSETAWQTFVAGLRRNAEIKINEAAFRQGVEKNAANPSAQIASH